MKTDSDWISVLLIDDDEIWYELIQAFLGGIEGVHCKLDWIADFEEGVKAIERTEHDVYLVDCQLGMHNGLDLLRTTHDRTYKVPFIMLTGEERHDVYLQAMELGAFGYLLKNNITVPLLEHTICGAISHAPALFNATPVQQPL